MTKDSLIGSYYKLDYKLPYSKPIILYFYDDTFVLSDSGTTYEWKLVNNNISIYIKDAVYLTGSLVGDRITSGLALSPLSGMEWEWDAVVYIPPQEPVLLDFNQSELLNGEWTIINDNDIKDNTFKFLSAGVIESKIYGKGSWEIKDSNELIIVTANSFITYHFKNVDGRMSGSANNNLGEIWEAQLKHSLIQTEKPVITRRVKQPDKVKIKTDSEQIKSYLNEVGITCFYHFTDSSNLDSIRKHGLLSWHYSQKNNISISRPGGDSFSRALDQKFKLQDYVRLSFCANHPMMYTCKKNNRITDPRILHISTDVALLENTLFTDINATDRLHQIGKGIDFLKTMDFDIFRERYYDLSTSSKKKYQAEILVKTCIPVKYILDLQN